MKFEYTGRHIDVTPALRVHVEEHFKRIDHLFNGKPAKAHVIIEVERGRHRSEIIVKWRNDVLTATTRLNDMYQSLSQSIDKIEKQALKLKNKVIDKSHRAKRASTIAQRNTEVRPAPPSPRIIKTRRYAVKPMNDDEAVSMLAAEENSFLVFRNAQSSRVSVIYKRKDGNFGLIEP
ncbi:MAG TPA: ribosome-associated translation inhibitor RaiA [Pyrinomonadaceae bacterium]|nr:ribosome-associated translation inhibitor RaiA [Pyrinomonadaceae bacterium]